jgi:hypothetical protein
VHVTRDTDLKSSSFNFLLLHPWNRTSYVLRALERAIRIGITYMQQPRPDSPMRQQPRKPYFSSKSCAPGELRGRRRGGWHGAGTQCRFPVHTDVRGDATASIFPFSGDTSKSITVASSVVQSSFEPHHCTARLEQCIRMSKMVQGQIGY